MYLARSADRLLIKIFFSKSDARHMKDLGFYKRRSANPLSDDLDRDHDAKQQLRIAGLVKYVSDSSCRITEGQLHPDTLKDAEEWVQTIEQRGRTTRTMYPIITPLHEAVMSYRHLAQQGIERRARMFDFLCAIEQLEGREGQHSQQSDEFVRYISSEPYRLRISDDKKRLVAWKIACFGSA